MDCLNSLPSFDASVGGQAGFSWQDDTTESWSYYRGMSVEAQNSLRPACFSQSNADQNNAHTINPLSEFRVASLTQDVPNSSNNYVLRKPDEESFDELFPILSSYLFDESPFSWNETDIGESTLANDLSRDHLLANIPAELASPQGSRPVRVDESLNLQQANSDYPVTSAEIAVDKSSQAERKSQQRLKRQRDLQRERRKNPAYVQRERGRYRNDSVYAERHRKRQRERQRELRKNPAYVERERDRYRNDTAFAERHRKRQRELQSERRKKARLLKELKGEPKEALPE